MALRTVCRLLSKLRALTPGPHRASRRLHTHTRVKHTQFPSATHGSMQLGVCGSAPGTTQRASRKQGWGLLTPVS